MKKTKIKWLDKPENHDYPAAESYLSLTMDFQAAKTVVTKLKSAGITKFAAKDICRASGYPCSVSVTAMWKKTRLGSCAMKNYPL